MCAFRMFGADPFAASKEPVLYKLFTTSVTTNYRQWEEYFCKPGVQNA
jgi:hypothetical protein